MKTSKKKVGGDGKLVTRAKGPPDVVFASASKPVNEMIPSLWQNLPNEILEKVLTKLPVPDLVRLQRVSKKWKALIRSEKFGRHCDSVTAAVLCQVYSKVRYIAIPNLETRTWEKLSPDFLFEGEVLYRPIAADRGLICYRILKEEEVCENRDIILVVQNPLTRKWRRLLVPYHLETESELENQHKMLGGLVMDQGSGSYKLVVAFFDEHLTRKTFIYDSSLESWSTSSSESPVLELICGDHYIGRGLCCGTMVFWLVQEADEGTDAEFKSLIKYDMEEDAWSMITEDFCHYDAVDFSVAAGDDGLVMMKLSSHRDFPVDILSFVPDMKTIEIEEFMDRLSQNEGVNFPANFEFGEAVFGGGTWFLAPDPPSAVFACREDPPSVTRLPDFQKDQLLMRLVAFVATFKAFV